MQVTLFKALKSINLDDDTATAVVAQTEDFIVRKVEDANKGLEAQLEGVKAQLKAQTWMIGAFGGLIGIMGAVATFGPVVQKMLTH